MTGARAPVCGDTTRAQRRAVIPVQARVGGRTLDLALSTNTIAVATSTSTAMRDRNGGRYLQFTVGATPQGFSAYRVGGTTRFTPLALVLTSASAVE